MPDSGGLYVAPERLNIAATRPMLSGNDLLRILRDRVPPPARSSARPLSEIIVGPWMRDLIRTSREAPPTRRIVPPLPSPPYSKLALATATAVALSFLPELLESYLEGHPVDPEMRLALDICAQTDRTFIRYLKRDRDGCYARYTVMMVGAHAVQPEHRPPWGLGEGIALR